MYVHLSIYNRTIIENKPKSEEKGIKRRESSRPRRHPPGTVDTGACVSLP